MSNLSQDELTVLMIAAQGESMMPIGRWEQPVESLIARGYLHRNDKFNNVITDAGRKAVAQDEDDTARQMIETNNAIVTARQMIETNNAIVRGKKDARVQAQQIATQLVDLAELSNKITGEDRKVALERWARIILTRALEMIGGH